MYFYYTYMALCFQCSQYVDIVHFSVYMNFQNYMHACWIQTFYYEHL